MFGIENCRDCTREIYQQWIMVKSSYMFAFIIRQSLGSVFSFFMCDALIFNCSGIVTYGILPFCPHQLLEIFKALG